MKRALGRLRTVRNIRNTTELETGEGQKKS